MKKIISLTLILCFSCGLLTSCYDSREIDEWAYVYTIGVDKGVSDQLRYTFQIPTMIQGGSNTGKSGGQGSSGASEQKSYSTITVDCPTFFFRGEYG